MSVLEIFCVFIALFVHIQMYTDTWEFILQMVMMSKHVNYAFVIVTLDENM